MLRITELRLPLDHAEDALRPAIVARLQLADAAELLDFHVFRRGYDARKKTAIVLTYTIDCTLRDEAAVFARFPKDHQIRPTPDTGYRFVKRQSQGDPNIWVSLGDSRPAVATASSRDR